MSWVLCSPCVALSWSYRAVWSGASEKCGKPRRKFDIFLSRVGWVPMILDIRVYVRFDLKIVVEYGLTNERTEFVRCVGCQGKGGKIRAVVESLKRENFIWAIIFWISTVSNEKKSMKLYCWKQFYEWILMRSLQGKKMSQYTFFLRFPFFKGSSLFPKIYLSLYIRRQLKNFSYKISRLRTLK